MSYNPQNANGQATSANSSPVVIASDQSVISTRVLEEGLVSTVNSSSTNLGASATFTGTAEDVSNYANASVTVFSSAASATDGLMLQQSADGTNWDIADSYTIPAVTGKTFMVGIVAKFLRVVYTNGAAATTSFRLQTLYNKNAKKGSSVRPQDARPNENDFEEMLSYLMGFNGTNWDRLRSTSNRRLAVDTDSTRLISFVGRSASYRITGRAGTTGQKLMSIFNAAGSTVVVDVEKITFDTETTVVKAVTVLPPVVRLYKITAAPTGGTAMTKIGKDSTQTSSASVTILGDASADGTNSATALAATLTAGNVYTQIFAPRLITAAGYQIIDRVEFLSGDFERITLRAGEGIMLNLDYTLATQNPATDFYTATVNWTEYTVVT
jgi:hypothetical protein